MIQRMTNKSKLYKYLALHDEVLIYSVDSKDVLATYAQNVQASAVALAAIGRLMSGALLMAGQLKDNERLLVSIDGNGPLGNLKAEADAKGNVRGFVSNPLFDVPLKENGHLDVGTAVGHEGYLTVTKQLQLKEPFVGSCALISGEIAEDISYYYGTSEQIPTVVALGVLINPDYSIGEAGGFFIQLLPNASEQTYQTIEKMLTEIHSVSDLLKKYGAEQMIYALFKDARLIDSYPVQFQCHCSLQYAKELIKKIDTKKLVEMIQEAQGVDITCNFCQKKYYLSTDDLKAIRKDKQE